MTSAMGGDIDANTMVCNECSDDEDDESMAQFTKSLRKSKCFSKTCEHECCQGDDACHIAEPMD